MHILTLLLTKPIKTTRQESFHFRSSKPITYVPLINWQGESKSGQMILRRHRRGLGTANQASSRRQTLGECHVTHLLMASSLQFVFDLNLTYSSYRWTFDCETTYFLVSHSNGVVSLMNEPCLLFKEDFKEEHTYNNYQ